MPTASLLSLEGLDADVFDLDLTLLPSVDGRRGDEFQMSEGTPYTTSCSSGYTYTPATCSQTCGGATGKPCAC